MAQKINEKVSVIQEYEAGRAIPNNQIVSKMEKALNCRLPRPNGGPSKKNKPKKK